MAGEFTRRIDQLTRRYEEVALTVFRRSWLQLLRDVVLMTPVRTGRARGSWNGSIGQPDFTVSQAVDSTGQLTLAKLVTVFASAPAGIWWLASGLPYIRALEYGHSQQAPGGMVRIAVARFNQGLSNLGSLGSGR